MGDTANKHTENNTIFKKEENMKRLLLVTLMVLVSLVGMVGFSRAAEDQAMQSILTQLKNIQQSLDAVSYAVSALQPITSVCYEKMLTADKFLWSDSIFRRFCLTG